jgi:hypothetical protein
VRLVVVDAAGTALGALPPFDLPVPYWPEAGDAAAGARQRHGVEVTLLRLLHADRPQPPGGTVTYAAELTGPPPPSGVLTPATDRDLAALAPHPLRQPYAEPGGPARLLAWAADALAAQGWPAVTPVQMRTWNLSAIWRLDAPDGRRAWFKIVPPFFRHEPALLDWLDRAVPGAAPPPLAADPAAGLTVMRDVPGEDWYEADPAGRDRVARVHHRVQLRAAGSLDELAAAGVPDRRGPRLAAFIRSALAGYAPAVDDVLPDLDARLAAAARCGLPDTLVHGDLHPGNSRRPAAGGDPLIMDWGDAHLGNPAFDIIGLTGGVDADAADRLRASWAARWRAAAPGSDPERAVALLGPVAPLYGAAVYATFLANIEPSERPYHATDPAAGLAAAAAAVASPTVAAGAPTVGA